MEHLDIICIYDGILLNNFNPDCIAISLHKKIGGYHATKKRKEIQDILGVMLGMLPVLLLNLETSKWGFLNINNHMNVFVIN